MTRCTSYRIRIDSAAYTFLAYCTCGWRDWIPRVSNVEAWRAGRDHEASCHPNGRQAARAYADATRRALRK